MRQPNDKGFKALLREHAAILRDERLHLIQRQGPKGTLEAAAVPNRIQRAPWLRSSPVVNGVRMRYERGKLVPRVS